MLVKIAIEVTRTENIDYWQTTQERGTYKKKVGIDRESLKHEI